MQLILVRHGIAEDAGPNTDHQDAPRALTPDGRARIEASARGMRVLGIRVDALLTSPLTRAQQTADIIGDALLAAPEDDGRLAPGMSLEDLHQILLEHPDAQRVMVCGHQPDLSAVVDDLTGGAVEFRKGSVAVIDVQDIHAGGGVLVALYPPVTLRRLGGE